MRIEQLLHGYHNGHHLIAGTVALPLNDADRMSYLSDWSGYVNPYDKRNDYITAYPLEESGYYVVAKSWYADEMSRPGCVWTHSLLFKPEDANQKTNLYELLKLFRRPDRESEDFQSYTHPLEISNERLVGKRNSFVGIDSSRFMYLAAGLIEGNKPMVYTVEKGADVYEDLSMRLLQNLPYGMMRRTALCSGSAMVRKFEKQFLNLQFVVGKGETLFEPFPQNVKAPSADSGFKFWMDSMLNGRDDVAQMMHHFSEDVGKDTNKFLALSNLLKMLNDRLAGTDNRTTLTEVLNYIVRAFPDKKEGMAVKKAFLSESVTNLFCDDRTFIESMSFVKESEAIDYVAIGFKDRAAAYRNKHTSDEYIQLLISLSQAEYLNAEGQYLLAESLTGLTEGELSLFANHNWTLFKSIVNLNPHILTSKFWIELSATQFLSLFALFQRETPKGFVEWERLYDRLLTLDTFVTDTLCREFVKNVDEYVRIALDKWNSQKTIPVNKTFMSLCMKHKAEVIKWMGFQTDIKDTLRAIVREHIQPDEDVVVKMGSAAWKSFVYSEMEFLRDANKMDYIYVLAFNWKDYNALSYIKAVLPYIYEALATETLDYFSWKKIERFTGEVPVWRFWDNCRKLLIGVKDYCKAMGLQVRDIEHFTNNEKLNRELLELCKKG